MNLYELKKYASQKMLDYPQLREEIWSYYELAYSEVEEGNNESRECDMAVNTIDFIINEMIIENHIEARLEVMEWRLTLLDNSSVIDTTVIQATDRSDAMSKAKSLLKSQGITHKFKLNKIKKQKL